MVDSFHEKGCFQGFKSSRFDVNGKLPDIWLANYTFYSYVQLS